MYQKENTVNGGFHCIIIRWPTNHRECQSLCLKDSPVFFLSSGRLLKEDALHLPIWMMGFFFLSLVFSKLVNFFNGLFFKENFLNERNQKQDIAVFVTRNFFSLWWPSSFCRLVTVTNEAERHKHLVIKLHSDLRVKTCWRQAKSASWALAPAVWRTYTFFFFFLTCLLFTLIFFKK